MNTVVVKSLTKLDYIDALRGWAVIGVVAVHVAQKVPDLPWPLGNWMLAGGLGVPLFFMVSAFTLMLSWRDRNDGTLPFYVRRLFRIAPLFWLALGVYGLIGWSRDPILAAQTFFFVNNLVPPDVGFSAVPGGWSIAIEMQFYVLFPLLAGLVTNLRRAIAFLALTIALFLALAALIPMLAPGKPAAATFIWDYGRLWFPGALPTFAAGFVAFHASAQYPWRGTRGALEALLLATLGVLLYALAALSVSAALLPLSFSLIVYALANGAGRYLNFSAVRRLGKISFGVYLWHFIVLDGVAMLVPSAVHWAPGTVAIYGLTLGGTVAIAAATHLLVEKPMIRLGHRFAAMAARKQPLPRGAASLEGEPTNP